MLKLIKRSFYSPQAYGLIRVLLLLDVCFIAIHILVFFLYYIGQIDDYRNYNFLDVTNDGSLAEFFQYLKYFFVLIMLVHLVYSKKRYPYISWFLLFAFFLLDDSLSLHETFGEVLVDAFNFQPMFGLRDLDFGELTFILSVGLILLSGLIIALIKGDSVFRKRTIDLLLLLLFFTYFGVGFDMLHVFLGENPRVAFIIGIIEDGGEMVTMSVMVWYILYFLSSQDDDRNYLFRLLVPEQSIQKNH
ncbi:MAG: hypothetical protein WA810_02185 [Maribacter sp.]